MIKACRFPGIGAMAVITGVITLDMGRRFSSSRSAVMAGKAGSRNIAMVKACRFPGSSIVAIITGIVTLDMH
jgi:hypothetical protein